MLYEGSVLKNFSKLTDKHKKQSSGGVLSKFTEKHLFRSFIFNKAAAWKPETSGSSHWRCFIRECALITFANSAGRNFFVGVSVVKVQFWGAATLLKKISTQMLYCEICKLFKSNYFEEHLWMSTSKLYLKKESNVVFSCEFCELFKKTYFVKVLQKARSETPVRGSVFSKIASLMVWRSLAVLKRDFSTGISLWILSNL